MDTKELIVLGARARIAELENEIAELRKIADGGARRGRRAKSGGASAPATAADSNVGTRKRRGMSAAQRKAVSERMRKYWAARRKSKA